MTTTARLVVLFALLVAACADEAAGDPPEFQHPIKGGETPSELSIAPPVTSARPDDVTGGPEASWRLRRADDGTRRALPSRPSR